MTENYILKLLTLNLNTIKYRDKSLLTSPQVFEEKIL